MDDWINIKTFPNRYEADLAKQRLESAGLEAMVSADDYGGMQPGLTFTMGARLLVKKSVAQKALGILEKI